MVRYLHNVPVFQESYQNFKITQGSRKGSFGGTRVSPSFTGTLWHAGIFFEVGTCRIRESGPRFGFLL